MTWPCIFLSVLGLMACGKDDPSKPPDPPVNAPPGRITNLTAEAVSPTSVLLRWMATGADGTTGTASRYDVRFATDSVAVVNWSGATRVNSLPPPKASGRGEHFELTGLGAHTRYFFGIKAADEDTLWSGLSNVAAAQTGSLLRLTTSTNVRNGAFGPDWSPDGSSIVFCADWGTPVESPVCQLYLVPPVGGNPVKLTHFATDARYPAWSPDGAHVAFVLEQYNAFAISTMNPTPDAQAVTLATHSRGYVCAPAWAFDSGRLAYSVFSPFGDVPGRGGYIVSSAGQSMGMFASGWDIWSLDWSPDGSTIAFAALRNSHFGIWIVDAAGGEPVELTADPAGDQGPAWSPDGSRIAFTSQRAGSWDIWVMSATGQNPVQLTSGPATDIRPRWSPDGTQIVYSSSGDNHVNDIWVLYL
jgi:Tol biopolymer transport system component